MNLFAPRTWLAGLVILAVVGTVVYSEIIARIEPKPGPVHVSYWEGWTGFEFDAMAAVVKDFNASQNKIHVDLLSISGIQDKTRMAISAGVPPDIAGLGSGDLPSYIDDAAFIPLDDFIKDSDIKRQDYIPIYWDLCAMYGHQFALPTTPCSTALHFNRDLFAKAGVDPDNPPKTVSELDKISDKITVKQGNGKLKIGGFVPNEPGWWNYGWGFHFGGKLIDDQGHITADSPENIKAFEWVASYFKRYGKEAMQAFHQGFGNFSSPQNAFMTQEVASEIQGVWMSNFIQMYNPKLNWDAAPFPYPDGHPELANTNYVDTDTLSIPVGAKHPKEAFEFMKYTQRQDVLEKLNLLQKKFSPLNKTSDHFWKVHENPKIRLFYELAKSKNVYSSPRVGFWSEYLAELNAAFDSITLLTKTPKQALHEVTVRMQPIMDRYLRRRAQRARLHL